MLNGVEKQMADDNAELADGAEAMPNVFSKPIDVNTWKGYNPEMWVDLAVRQCLGALLMDNEKYIAAVDNLEAVLSPRLKQEYYDKIKGEWTLIEADSKKGEERNAIFRLSQFKFRQLVSHIESQRMKEVELVM